MKFLNCKEQGYTNSSSNITNEIPPQIIETVQEIISSVKKNGDKAVIEYTEKFDAFSVKDFPLEIPPSDLKKAYDSIDDELKSSLEHAAKRIEAFHMEQKEDSWQRKDEYGSVLGQLINPIERAGLYIPGGKACYPSSVLMNGIPAKIAGVKEIIMVVPSPGGELNNVVLAAAYIAGVNRVFRVGGAQAVAALAFGTETIPKVDKVVGPGNIYVATAKQLLFGYIDIDMFAGPSEILIIADKTANPQYIAADFLSQAEHDERATAILITNDLELAKKAEEEIIRQTRKSRRREIIEKSLDNNGEIIVVNTLDEAFLIANERGPEHLEVMTQNPEQHIPKVKNAGALFLGDYSPEPIGDYIAGPNHVLPTMGTSRFFSPLGVYDFVKKTSLIYLNKSTFNTINKDALILADIEGLDAHAESIRIRD
ncbi:MAG: histidinol dehydrogenase [Nitrospinae bacterium]|nr:histidinol dehydrogenase [Nitrospinota bacterium]